MKLPPPRLPRRGMRGWRDLKRRKTAPIHNITRKYNQRPARGITKKEKNMKIESIKSGLKNLEDLYMMKKSATEAYSEAIKNAAADAEITPAALRRIIAARMDDKKEAAAQEASEVVDIIEALDVAHHTAAISVRLEGDSNG